MRKSDNIRELEWLASSQWGIFTTAQAARLGVGRTQISRMAAGGTVEQVRRGTYRYAVGEETSHSYAKAAWLACYPKLTAAERLRERPHDAVLACNTAASLHGIGDLHEDPYTFIVRSRRQTSASDLSFHLWDLDERDVTYVEGLPVTTMERTIADLVRERHDPDHVARAAQAAYLKGASVARINELLGELGPSYDNEVAILGTSDGLRATDGDLAEEIVADVMAMFEMRARGTESEPEELAPMEQALVEAVRRRLRPILEERATKMEERRLRGASATENIRRIRISPGSRHGNKERQSREDGN